MEWSRDHVKFHIIGMTMNIFNAIMDIREAVDTILAAGAATLVAAVQAAPPAAVNQRVAVVPIVEEDGVGSIIEHIPPMKVIRMITTMTRLIYMACPTGMDIIKTILDISEAWHPKNNELAKNPSFIGRALEMGFLIYENHGYEAVI